MRTLLISLILAVLPIAILVALVLNTPNLWPPTIDNLFTTLILLLISGVFLLNAALEIRAAKARGGFAVGGSSKAIIATTGSGRPVNATVETGIVEDVRFYEAHVGDVDKCILTFRPIGSKETRLLVFEGDIRDQLPVGRKVTISYKPEGKQYQLLSRSYA
jgi:hypothetical protein